MFRQERFIDKTTRLSAVIHRSNLKSMKTIRSKPQKTIKKTIKELNIADKNIEIARDRGVTTETLLLYDVVPSPLLFDEEGLMTKPDKSQLLKELETSLKPDDYGYKHQRNSNFIIDVMANVRKVRLTRLATFQELITAFSTFTDIYTMSLGDVTMFSICTLKTAQLRTVRE